MSIAEVTARIQQIQERFDPAGPPTISATEFANQLQQSSSVAAKAASFAAPSATSSTGVTGSDVVADAKKYLGVPYVWGGTDPKTGLDCSGLVQRVYADLGYSLPRVSYDQVKAGRPVNGLANAQPGDILGFNSPASHVAIYIGGGKMIEEPRPGLSARISDVYETPTFIRRILPDTSTHSVARSTNDLALSLDRARLGLGQNVDLAQVLTAAADGVTP